MAHRASHLVRDVHPGPDAVVEHDHLNFVELEARGDGLLGEQLRGRGGQADLGADELAVFPFLKNSSNVENLLVWVSLPFQEAVMTPCSPLNRKMRWVSEGRGDA